MAKQIIIGIFVAAIGGVLVYFSAYMVEAFGRIAWAENKLGGTRNGYLLFGFGLILIGLLIMFGVISLGAPADNLPTINQVPTQ